MTLRTFVRPLWAALMDPYGRRATARELIQARRHAQAVALRDAAEWVDLLGDKPVWRTSATVYRRTTTGWRRVWRTLNELVRAGVDDATLRQLIEHHAADASKQQPPRRRVTQPADH